MIEPGKIKAVIFDINGVVVQPRYDRLYKYILQAPAILADKARGDRSAPGRYLRLYIETRRLDEEVMDMASKLRIKGYLTPALSNAEEPAIEAARSMGAYKGFDPIILSGEVGFEKPDRRIFELVASRIGLKNDQCVFVDDNQDFVSAAAGLGFYGIVFKDPARLLKDLERIGVNV